MKAIQIISRINKFLLLGLFFSCATGIERIPMNTKIGNLNIAPEKKILLKVGVFISELQTYKVIVKEPDRTPMDQTVEFPPNVYPLNSELSKASLETFNQIFISSILTDQSKPDLDLILQPQFEKIFIRSDNGLDRNILFDWSLKVLTKDGVSILEKKSKTKERKFMMKISFNNTKNLIKWGAVSSHLIQDMMEEITILLTSSNEIKEVVSKSSIKPMKK